MRTPVFRAKLAVELLCLCLALLVSLSSPVTGESPRFRPFETNGPVGSLLFQPGSDGLSLNGPPLLKGNDHPFRTKAELRPDLSTVRLTRTLKGKDYGWPEVTSLDNLLVQARRMRQRNLWREDTRQSSNARTDSRGGRGLRINIPVHFPDAISRVIGEGSSLRVTGTRKISFSGRSQWTEGQVQTATSKPSKFPSLNMEQQSRFTIEGTIGERIHVQVDQDSRRQSELENAIKMSYDGDEDRIIQKIEAGNTTLSLPGTRFVGFSSQHKGLFGIRMEGKLGGLDFTTIASQEKASGQRKTFKGLAQESTNKIREWQYLERTYFFLDRRYRDRFRDGEYNPDDDIQELRVYVDDRNTNNDLEDRARSGLAYIDPNAPQSPSEGSFHELDPSEYLFDPATGYLLLSTSIRAEYDLAVTYRTAGGETFGDVEYDTNSEAPIQLKLIKARNQRPGGPTWDLEWKNVYRIGSREIDPDGLELRIFKELPGSDPDDTQNGVPYIQVFGLDRMDRDGSPRPDNLVDLHQSAVDLGGGQIIAPVVDLERGELIFPDLQPFDPLDPDRAAQLDEKVPKIYTAFDQQTKREVTKYYIEIRTASRQTRFSLGEIGGVMEDSEEVILNGKRLKRGVDYNIEYFAGEITFYTDEVKNPAADLVINYDVAPVFAFASQQKTLLGTRGEYKFWGNSHIGSTVLYNNQRSSDKRVRVGSEPARTILWDSDVRLDFQPRFLTAAVDALPLLETDAASKINIAAEVAQSRPNPNTKGAGFIDDFEGSSRQERLGVLRGIWTQASVPEGKIELNAGRLVWYNPFERVAVTEIWPNRDVSAQENRTDVLALEFFPGEQMTYYPPPQGPEEDAWGGVMRAFRGGGLDVSRAKFLEIWARGEEGLLNVDLGAISEDVVLYGDTQDERPSRGNVNTEDKALYGQRNSILDIGEDVGLDGLSDEEEGAVFPEDEWFSPEDPAGDNWSYRNKSDYTHINGTEGSKDDGDRGLRPDSEDINNSGFLDRKNAYYHYSIDLSSDRFLVPDTESNGWRLYRIPLKDHEPADGLLPQVGIPDGTMIEFARLWVTGVREPTKVEIASVEVVRNEWLEDDLVALSFDYPLTGEEKFDVTTKSTDQNQDYKDDRPPGVKVKTDPFTGITEREQSLVLKFEELGPEIRASATKIFPQRADYTLYTRLQMYVHGDSTFVDGGDTSTVDFFVQFGPDTTNYYEYRTYIYPGWDMDRNEVDVDLEFVSNLKGILLDAKADKSWTPEKIEAPEGFVVWVDSTKKAVHARQEGTPRTYTVHGNPALSNVKVLRVGLVNRGEDALSGEIWLDELRLEQVRREPGLAARVSMDAGFADFMNLSFDLSWKEADFRTLTGSSKQQGNTDRTTGVRGDVNLDRFLPSDWGASIPVSISWEKSESQPRLKPGSDVVLTPDQRLEERTDRERRTANVSFRKRAVSSNWLSSLTLDRISMNFSVTEENGRSPRRPESWNLATRGSFRYDLSSRKKHTVKPFGWSAALMPDAISDLELQYLLSRLSYSADVDRRRFRYVEQAQASQRRAFLTQQEYEAFLGQFAEAGEILEPLAQKSGFNVYIDLDAITPEQQEELGAAFDELDRYAKLETTDDTFKLNRTYDLKVEPFRGFSADYKLQTVNDPSDSLDIAGLYFGRETRRVQNASTSLDLNFIRWLKQRYSFRADYSEDNDPKLHRGGVQDQPSGRDVTVRSNVSANLTFELPSILRSLGGSGGPTRRARPKQKEEDEDKEDGETPKPSAGRFILFRMFGALGSRLNPVSGGYTRKRDVKAYGLLDRPGLAYQLGLADSADVEVPAEVSGTRRDTRSFSNSLTFDSGLKLFADIGVKTKYSRQWGNNATAGRDPRHTQSVTFPNVSGQWGKANIPLLSRLMNSSSLNSSYESVTSSDGEGGLDPEYLRRKTYKVRFSPLLSWTARWKGGLRTTLKTSRERSEDEDFRDGAIWGRTQREQETLSLTLDYSFSASQGIPLFIFKRIRLKSKLDLSLDFQTKHDQQKEARGDSPPVPRRDDSDWSVKLRSSYRFSQKFTGGAKVEFGNRLNQLTDTTRKTREVGFWGEIRFD